MGAYNMFGIPADGSKPFLMAILDGPGAAPIKAAELFRATAHLYSQKLMGWRIEPRENPEPSWPVCRICGEEGHRWQRCGSD